MNFISHILHISQSIKDLIIFKRMAQDFIKNTITHSPIDRMTAEQCLEHPYLLGEERKSHPITNKEIIQRYKFI